VSGGFAVAKTNSPCAACEVSAGLKLCEHVELLAGVVDTLSFFPLPLPLLFLPPLSAYKRSF
jgi:hypothetical protein